MKTLHEHCLSLSFATVMAVGSSLFLAAGASAQDETIELKAITPYPAENYLSQPLFLFGDIVEEKTNGRVKLEYLGGAEVVPAFEQFDAVRNGTVDVALGVASYYTGSVPEGVGIQYNASKLPGELRAAGYHDLMQKLHADKGNVVYVANASGTPGEAFRLYTSKAVASIADLNGLKFRVSPVYTAIVQAMGGTPVALPPADTYSALERGIVDGLGWTYAGTLDYGFPEVAKYVINHPFYSLNSAIIMNQETWDDLPDEVKQQIEEASVEFEKQVVAYYADYIAQEDARLKEAGVEFVTFSDAEAKQYTDAAYDAGWAKFLEENPEHGQAIKDMMTK